MGYEEDGPAVLDDLLEPLHALVLELLVPYGEHLVHDQDLGLQERRHSKREPDIHTAGITLHGGVDELLDSGEGDDVVEFGGDLLPGHAEDGAIHEDVVPAGQIALKACSYLEKAADPAVDPDDSLAGGRDAGDDLEEGRLPCPVGPDDRDRLSLLDVKVDVLEGVEEVGGLGFLLGLGLRIPEGVIGVELALGPAADVAEELTAVDLTQAVDLGDVLNGDGEGGHGRNLKYER